MTADLPARILAAIEADEQTARAAAEAFGSGSSTPPTWTAARQWERMSKPISAHIRRHDPARVLARCAADRRLVEILHRAAAEGPTDTWNPADSALLDGLRALAAGYGIESGEEA